MLDYRRLAFYEDGHQGFGYQEVESHQIGQEEVEKWDVGLQDFGYQEV